MFKRLISAWLAVSVLFAGHHAAWAQAQPSDYLRYGTNTVQAVGMPGIGTADFDRFMGRVFNGSSAGIVADVRLNGNIRGATVPFTVTRTFPTAAVTRAVSRALGIAGAGLAIVALVNETRCRNTGTPLLPIFECDPGEAGSGGMTSMGDVFSQYSGSGPGGTWPSAEAACAAVAAYNSSAMYGGAVTFTNPTISSTGPPYWGCNVDLVRNSDGVTTEYNKYMWAFQRGAAPPPSACPSGLARSTLGGVAFCPSGTYSPATESDVADRVGQNPGFQGNPSPPVIGAGQVGSQPEGGTTTIGAPGTVNLPSTTRNGQGTGGGTWTETRTPVATVTCSGDTCSWTITTTTTRTTTNADGTVTVDTTTETDGTGTQGESITCGLPNTPPCKIDERGTPTSAEYGTARSQMDQRGTEAKNAVDQAATPRPLPWMWGGVTLPASACIDLVAPGPIDAIPDRPLDLCGQPWVAWWRTAWAWLCGLWVASYCWRRFSDTVEGT